jgi:hypothetical protein
VHARLLVVHRILASRFRSLTEGDCRYLPGTSGGAAAAFVLMFVFHAAQVLSKAVAMGALANTCWWWLVVYMSFDICLYMLYKIARRDFWWWVPTTGVGFALIGRGLMKVLVDFSGCVHFRNPVDLGGAYWLFNAVMSQLSCIVSIILYDRYFVGDAKISGLLLYGTVGALVGVWFVAFCAFLLIIKPRYVHTFVSLQSGSDYIISYFRDNVDEARRIEIFYCNELMWDSIRPAVRAWVRRR